MTSAKRKALLLSFLALGPLALVCPLAAGKAAERNSVWTVGLAGERFSFKAGDGFEFSGNSGQVALGFGYLQPRWFASVTGELIIGPFNPATRREEEIDYLGTGIKVWWGYSAQDLDLRHPDGGYGFVLGLAYADFTGRSLGINQAEPLDPQSLEQFGLRHSYALRVANMAVMPGIFFCWLEAPREAGPKPSQLKTRVEGYLLTLAFSLPLFSNYQGSYLQRDLKDKYRNGYWEEYPDKPAEPLWEDRPKQEKGNLQGFSILLSLGALLGV